MLNRMSVSRCCCDGDVFLSESMIIGSINRNPLGNGSTTWGFQATHPGTPTTHEVRSLQLFDWTQFPIMTAGPDPIAGAIFAVLNMPTSISNFQFGLRLYGGAVPPAGGNPLESLQDYIFRPVLGLYTDTDSGSGVSPFGTASVTWSQSGTSRTTPYDPGTPEAETLLTTPDLSSIINELTAQGGYTQGTDYLYIAMLPDDSTSPSEGPNPDAGSDPTALPPQRCVHISDNPADITYTP